MHKFTRIVVPALAAIAALGSAGVASAQPYGGYDHGRDPGRDWGRHQTPARAEAIRAQIVQLEQRVNRSDNRDRISEREAWGLRREVRDIREQFRAFNRDGLNDREFRILQTRIDRARDRLHFERTDRNGRPDGRRW
ncbi:hypothetical protein ACFOD9_07760 [Novosphingobium bradum]|uniref:Uncharacterized protein n=1 Tax=Novosphingobium bradum TaxID=1737444 RepID=A0ABV7IQB3_9SPHN